jgi:hypothetical protein
MDLGEHVLGQRIDDSQRMALRVQREVAADPIIGKEISAVRCNVDAVDAERRDDDAAVKQDGRVPAGSFRAGVAVHHEAFTVVAPDDGREVTVEVVEARSGLLDVQEFVAIPVEYGDEHEVSERATAAPLCGVGGQTGIFALHAEGHE